MRLIIRLWRGAGLREKIIRRHHRARVNKSIIMSRVVIHGTHRDGQVAKIIGLQASLLRPEEMMRMSVQEIAPQEAQVEESPKDKTLGHRPKTILAQLNSTHLGTVDYREYCQTCHNMNVICPSHASHHRLEWPVIHIGFTQEVIKVMHHVCYFCANLIEGHDDQALLDVNQITSAWLKQQWQTINRSVTKYKHRTCSVCDMPQPKYSAVFDLIKIQWTALEDDFPNPNLIARYKIAKQHVIHATSDSPEHDDALSSWYYRVRAVMEPETRHAFTQKPFTPRDAQWMFDRLSDQAVWLLGRNPQWNHPKWMIWNTLPIAGRIVHPSVSESNGSSSKGINDITTQYKTIISKNLELREWKIKYLKQKFGSAECPEAQRWWHCCDSRGPLEYPADMLLLIAGMHMEVSCLMDRKPVKQEVHHSGRTGAKNLKSQSNMSVKIIQHSTSKQGHRGDDDDLLDQDGSAADRSSDGHAKRKKRKYDQQDKTHSDAQAAQWMKHVDIHVQKVGLAPPPVSKFKKKQLKTLAEHNHGKSGNFRGHVSGKRADKTDRMVIVSDASLALYEVGVPMCSIMNQTYPRRVNDRNRDYLLHRVLLGPNHPDGATLIVTEEGSEIWLEDLQAYPEWTKPKYLQNGWMVHLHLDESQWAIANRQPSLHKGSMMAHRIRKKHGKAMGINDNVTTPYNGDFDGDEMNMTHPQSMHARATAQLLMAVDTHMICPKSHRLIVGLKQDPLLGSFLLTDRNTFLDEEQCATIRMTMEQQFQMTISRWPDPVILKPKRLWTGKQIWSIILPEETYYIKSTQGSTPVHHLVDANASDLMDVKERLVVIHHGALICGRITNAVVGVSQNTLIQQLWRYVGKREACDIMSTLTWLIHSYMQCRGFTIGAQDVVLGMDHHQQAVRIKHQLYDNLDALYEYVGQQCMRYPIHAHQYHALLKHLNQMVKQSNDYVQRLVVHSVSARPTLMDLMESGSKGSINHMTQITASVGLQQRYQKMIGAVDDDVVNRSSDVWQARLLAHHAHGEKSPSSLGLIQSSFSDGLSPEASFKHCMVSWPTIHEAGKPEKAGYLQRKLSKMSEGCSVQYDGTVRDENGNIIQLVYGGDGTDATLVTQTHLSPKLLSNVQYMDEMDACLDGARSMHDGRPAHQDDMIRTAVQMDHYILSQVRHDPSMCRACQQEQSNCQTLIDMIMRDYSESYFFDYMTEAAIRRKGITVYTPIDVPTIIQIHAHRWKDQWHQRMILPIDQRDAIMCMTDDDYDHYDFWQDVSQMTMAVHHHGSPFIQKQSLLLIMHEHLKYMHPAYQYWKADRPSIRRMLQHVFREYVQSFCDPGECVGSIACQSISEPSTQLILRASTKVDTHDLKQLQHLDTGLPRLEEIYGYNPTKCPSLTAVLDPRWIKTYRQAQRLCQQWIGRTLGDCIDDCHTLWLDTQASLHPDPDDRPPVTLQGQILAHHPMHAALAKALIKSYQQVGLTCPRYHVVIICPWRLALLEEMSLIAWDQQLRLGLTPYQHATWIDHHWIMWMHVHPSTSATWLDSTMLPTTAFATHYEFCHKFANQLCDQWVVIGQKHIEKLTGIFFDQERSRYVAYLMSNQLGFVMAHPATIAHACTTSDLHEIQRLFGEEALNQSIAFETHMVLCGDGSTYVQPRHTQLMADIMCMEDKVNRMNRSGLDQREGVDFTVKMSFEKTAKHILESGIYAQEDRLTGMTANIMFGTPSPYAGTGITRVYAPEGVMDDDQAHRTGRDYTASRPTMDMLKSVNAYVHATLSKSLQTKP